MVAAVCQWQELVDEHVERAPRELQLPNFSHLAVELAVDRGLVEPGKGLSVDRDEGFGASDPLPGRVGSGIHANYEEAVAPGRQNPTELDPDLAVLVDDVLGIGVAVEAQRP